MFQFMEVEQPDISPLEQTAPEIIQEAEDLLKITSVAGIYR